MSNVICDDDYLYLILPVK